MSPGSSKYTLCVKCETHCRQKVAQYTLQYKLVKKYLSISDIAKDTCIPFSNSSIAVKEN